MVSSTISFILEVSLSTSHICRLIVEGRSYGLWIEEVNSTYSVAGISLVVGCMYWGITCCMLIVLLLELIL
jgi:hypothetical protein